ncbi:hypothetical protein BFP70_02580 [Thioclava sp. SK-1]|uniref:Hint domain-containing protein n=1 Tax=Thioclava sp. SK-1 TaxID=1889770 RepID=UPI0008246297|nr:Hint domain-containing protein [Thioclava sp. SK-1]OCX67072.1 hypothetical protein BFP70_02580 [Thioclava sp. SK-1]
MIALHAYDHDDTHGPLTIQTHVSEQNARFASGIYAGTAVITPRGPRQIAALRAGDLIETFDDGPQPITAIEGFNARILDMALPRALWPIGLAQGMLGNRRPVRLAPNQAVMLESDSAEQAFGDPFVMVPAATLLSLPCARLLSPSPFDKIYHIRFDTPQLIMTADAGVMLCEPKSLLHHWADTAPLGYTTLPLDYAQELLAQDIDCAGGIAPYLQKLTAQIAA